MAARRKRDCHIQKSIFLFQMRVCIREHLSSHPQMVSCIQIDKFNKLKTIDISVKTYEVRQCSKVFFKALGNFRREGAKSETLLKFDPDQEQ
jgi:hypothetical protein